MTAESLRLCGSGPLEIEVYAELHRPRIEHGRGVLPRRPVARRHREHRIRVEQVVQIDLWLQTQPAAPDVRVSRMSSWRMRDSR